MFILLARTPFTNGIVQTNRIEQYAYTHICNAVILLSKNMIRKKNWNYNGKYFLGMVFTSILLLSSFGILTHNVFANAGISSAQTSSNVKHVNAQTEINNKFMHMKSPTHIPPLILEQYMQSKICKSKCAHPQSP